MKSRFTWNDARGALNTGLAFLEGEGRGLAGSLALHGLFVLLALVMLLHRAAPPAAPPRFVPVDVVHLGDETVSPPAPVRDRVPRPFVPHTEHRPPASANAPDGTSAKGTKPLPDNLDTRLNALAHLRQPQSNTVPLTDPAAETAAASDAAPGRDAAYAVRDLIRAQVLRKWTFDVPALGAKGFVVALRVVVLKSGMVASVEVLDRERFTRDALYRDIAISARNAVLLASPLTLPSGAFGERIDLTLNLNPRDALR